MITRLEALADAITDISGYHTPESAVYKARNPVLYAHTARPFSAIWTITVCSRLSGQDMTL